MIGDFLSIARHWRLINWKAIVKRFAGWSSKLSKKILSNEMIKVKITHMMFPEFTVKNSLILMLLYRRTIPVVNIIGPGIPFSTIAI